MWERQFAPTRQFILSLINVTNIEISMETWMRLEIAESKVYQVGCTFEEVRPLSLSEKPTNVSSKVANIQWAIRHIVKMKMTMLTICSCIQLSEWWWQWDNRFPVYRFPKAPDSLTTVIDPDRVSHAQAHLFLYNWNNSTLFRHLTDPPDICRTHIPGDIPASYFSTSSAILV